MEAICGNDTETALQDFQGKPGFQANGKITDETWAQLTKEPPPVVLDRCWQLTADFEGHGFRKLVGNVDGAGLTWGIIGFTIHVLCAKFGRTDERRAIRCSAWRHSMC